MIKQDYLIRMIQEIVALLVNALLRRKRIRQEDWSEYDAMASQLLGLPLSQLQTVDVDELADRYAGEESGIEKMELASLYLLRLSEETEGSIVFKSKLRQDGLRLLKRKNERTEQTDHLDLPSPSVSRIKIFPFFFSTETSLPFGLRLNGVISLV